MYFECMPHIPAQHTKNEVHDEERSNDDQRNEVDPGKVAPHRVVHLIKSKRGVETKFIHK